MRLDVAALLLAGPLVAPAVIREIDVSRAGRTALVLDSDVYNEAQEDLSDLRVLDAEGHLVPFVLDRSLETSERDEPRILNRAFLRGRSESCVLDFATPAFRRELTLRLEGNNFRRRVEVEGSDDQLSWTTLTDTAYVFAIPSAAARFETIPLPENNQRYLRVRVLHGEGDPERFEIQGAWASSARRRAGPTATIVPPLTFEDTRERGTTVLRLDLGARFQPFRSIVLDVDDRRFLRSVSVLALRTPPPPKPPAEKEPEYAVSLGQGCIYRYEEGGRTLESLRLDVSGRERLLRLVIRNGDDRPLVVQRATVIVPRERVLFEAAPSESYRLTYGSPGLSAPTFDLSRTMGETEAWAASASPATLGGVKRPAAPRPPWSERHPALLWAGLLAAVAALGVLTWRALKTAPV